MRRWIAIALLVLLPAQWAWGALAPVCTESLGQPLGPSQVAGPADAADDAAGGEAHGSDCTHGAVGHAPVMAVIAAGLAAGAPVATSMRWPATRQDLPDTPMSPPERPQWPRLA